MTEWISVILAALVVENFALVKPLGADTFLGAGRRMKTAAGMGLCVTFAVTVTAAVCRLLYTVLLKPLELEYLGAFLAVVIIALTVQVMEIVMQKKFPDLHKALGIYTPIIAGNSALLFIAAGSEISGYPYLMSVVYAFFSGLGFLAASLMLSMIMERCMYSDVPKPFRGVPAALIGAGLLALVFMGFQGFGVR